MAAAQKNPAAAINISIRVLHRSLLYLFGWRIMCADGCNLSLHVKWIVDVIQGSGLLNPVLKSLIMFLYPSQCRHCGENLDATEHYICGRCWSRVKPIAGKLCQTCGYPLGDVSISPSSCKWCLSNMQFRKARSAVELGNVVR